MGQDRQTSVSSLAPLLDARRIAVIGSPGSGKTRLARKLADVTGAPHYSLDDFYWRAGWLRPRKETWAQCMQQLVRGEQWIIDGNYLGTMRTRLQAADAVILLDLSTSTCLFGIVQRWLVQMISPKSTLPKSVAAGATFGSRFYLDPKLARMVWRFRTETRPHVLAEIAHVDRATRVIALRTRAEINAFLASIAIAR